MVTSKSKTCVIIIDSCYSGAAGVKGGDIAKVFSEVPDMDRMILSASSGFENAKEDRELKHGIFTNYLLEGLKGEAGSDKLGQISIEELYNYAYKKTRERNPRQTPMKKGESKIIIGKNPKILKENIFKRKKAKLIHTAKVGLSLDYYDILYIIITKIYKTYVPLTEFEETLRPFLESLIEEKISVKIFNETISDLVLDEKLKKLNISAQQLFDEKKFQESIDKWKEMLTLDTGNEMAEYGIQRVEEEIKKLNISAQHLFDDKKLQESIDKWKEILTLDPGNETAKVGIKKAEEEIKKLDISAQQLFDEKKFQDSKDKRKEILTLDTGNETAKVGIKKAKDEMKTKKKLLPIAFMSYVHFDDEYENGRLTEFRERLSAEVEMQTGDEFPIFQDRKDIKWGQNWKERLEETIDNVTFLIPILTPKFFKSTHCREELERFIEREKELGRNDLILPVYYVSSKPLDDERIRATDKLAMLLASRQYTDWRDLRFEPLTSGKVRERMVKLALQISEALERVRTKNEDFQPEDNQIAQEGKEKALEKIQINKTESMRGIFISYRREDSAAYAGRLFDRLKENFDEDRVFMDISAIEPGIDFTEAIDKALNSCNVLLAFIGKQWLNIKDARGRRRLDDEKDLVRQELRLALNMKKRLIPVLVGGASMPRPEELPEDISRLTRFNAMEISDTRWDYDSDRLIEVLEKLMEIPLEEASLSRLYEKFSELQYQFFERFPDDLQGSLETVSSTLNILDRVLAIHPDDLYLQDIHGFIFKNKAMVMEKMNRRGEFEIALKNADKIFKAVIDKNPLDSDAWNGLANVEILRQEPENALKYIEKALEINPKNEAVLHDKEIALAMLKKKSG
jgi:tetratricopeptide (TPR) repeat protein